MLHGARVTFHIYTKIGPIPTTTRSPSGNSSWDVYREMWGPHGEYVIDGNLKSVEYGRPALSHQGADIDYGRRPRRVCAFAFGGDEQGDPGSKLVVLPKSGHMTFVDQPDMFIRTIDDFLHQKQKTD